MLIVVARYNEDVEWTRQFPNVLIYNKGESLNTEVPLYNEIQLENVGREGHTYYKYICDNYDNLEDYTVFLQGNPFYHSPNLLGSLNILFENKDYMRFDFNYLSEKLVTCNLEKCYYHFEDLPLKDVYEKLFGKRIDNLPFIFGTGAQFVVSKNAILRKPKEFYRKIVEMLQNEICPIEGYVIERFHMLIFR